MDASGRRVLAEAVAKVRNRIEQIRERNGSIGEQDTKATLIEPVLAALGWRLEELDDVRREYKVKPQDNPVDYALVVMGRPRLFVEAKPLGTALDRKSASQVLGYASVTGVWWCLVTNGDEYRLYNSHAPVDVDEKLFRTVRLADPAQEALSLDTLSLLAKDAIGDSTIEAAWKSQFVDRRVKGVLEDALRDEDGSFAKHLRKRAPELSLAEVRESLKRADVRVNYPVVIAGPPFVASTGQTESQAEPPSSPAPTPNHQPRATPLDLIKVGLITLPWTMEAAYKGQRVTATIDEYGSVVFDGAKYGSLSRAGGAAKALVNGTPPTEPVPATNGWTFWQYQDVGVAGLRGMDLLQKRYLKDEG